MKLGGGLFGIGAGAPSRFPYPGRPQPSPAVGPSSATVVRANRVIVTGPNGGIYVYSGPPASGNLIESIGIVSAGLDPFRLNAVVAGDTRYHNNGAGVYVAQQSTQSYVAYLWQATSPLGPYVATGTYISFTAEFGTTPNVQVGAALTSVVGVAPGGGTTQAVTFVPPTGDATGAGDLANITTALALGAVQLLPGTYYLKSPLAVGGGYLNLGAATVQPGSAWSQPAGTPMITVGSGSTFGGGTLYGGTNTRSSNPACDAVSVAAGATRFHILPYTCNYMNGYVLNPGTITAAAHGTVGQILGTNNAGGVLLAAASSGISAQYSIAQVNLQQCEVNEAIFLQHVFDVTISDYNCSVLGTAGVPTVHLAGKCTTCILIGTNAGVQGTPTAGVPVLHVEDLAGASVTDCKFVGATFQQGGHGIVVDGVTARCQWLGVTSKGNAGDGWQFNGTGTALYLGGCYGNTNTGTADVNVTSTAHVGLDHFAYCSSGVTNSLVVPGTNHVSNDNPTNPGGKAVSGAPAGW